jgi:glycosyltransferase involved in cell wall biosynthesis
MQRGLVTTIIPVFNREQMILEAFDSVLHQTYRPLEIILVNDGSTDNTPAVLDRLAAENPGIVRVLHQHNTGPGLAREAGRKMARGEFIQYLDSDDWLLPRKFMLQVQALRDNPDCDIAYGISRLVSHQGQALCERSKRTGEKIDYLFPALLLDRWWHTHTPLFRRSICDAAGPWPPRRPEDWDLEARMGALRPRLVFCNEVLSCQRDHPGQERVTRGKKEAYLRDEAWFLPRLYRCALQAGVAPDAPEMQHFSRWSFMRARHLGALGEVATARRLYALAVQSGTGFSPSLRGAGLLARLLGWKAVGQLAGLKEKLSA